MSATRSSEPTTRRREGPDLDSLVAEIAADHPQPVRFLDVDRVRRGGVLGFFAKEQYALTYELDDDAVLAPPAASGAHRRLDRRDDLDPLDPSVDLEDLLGAADAYDIGPAPAPAPTGPTLGEVLAAGSSSTSSSADRFADILVNLARDVARDLPDPVDLPALVELSAPEDAAPTVAPVDVSVPAPFVVDDDTVGRHRGDGATVVAPTPLVVAPPAAPPVQPSAPVLVTPAVEPAADPVVVPPLTSPAAADDVVAAQLAALGVDPAARSAVDPGRAAVVAALLAVVADLPTPPRVPLGAGDLVVVVDGGTETLAGLPLTPASGGRDARRAVAAVRAADGPGVVAVRSDDEDGLAATVAAADLVVVRVTATAKTEDQRRTLDRVRRTGGRVDALVVADVEATASPASVLRLGVPVLTLDGRPADATTWLTVLLAALEPGRV